MKVNLNKFVEFLKSIESLRFMLKKESLSCFIEIIKDSEEVFVV